jgi:hypothetical protein
MNSCINDPVCERCGEKAAYAYEPVTIKMDADTFVVCYKRIEDCGPPMSWRQAVHIRKCLQQVHPDNFYVIEGVMR